MGRPIKKKFFGNLNQGSSSVTTDDGIGGEGISSVVSVISTGSSYSAGATLAFTSPQLPGGAVAAGTPTVVNPGGYITAVTMTDTGSGYTSTATISVTTATGVSKLSTGTGGATTIQVANTSGIYIGMTVLGDAGLGGAGNTAKVTNIGAGSVTVSPANDGTFTGVTLTFADLGSGFVAVTALTATQQNAIAGVAYIPTGSSAIAFDIIKQEAAHRYLVKTAQGTGQCKLVAASPSAGEMTIIASDSNSPASTYYVTKLTAHRAVLTRKTNGGAGYEYATGDVAGWTLNGATTGVVSIANN